MIREAATARTVCICALALGLGCGTTRRVHRPPTLAEIREINADARIRVVPIPTTEWVRRGRAIDYVVSADPAKIVAFSAGAPTAFPLGEVADFRARRRDRGAAIGAGVGAAAGVAGTLFLLSLRGMGHPDPEDPSTDAPVPVGEIIGIGAIGTVACAVVGAVSGALIGAPERFPLVLGPLQPAPSPADPPPRPHPPLPQTMATVVAPSADVRSAPFKVAPVVVSLTRGERVHVARTANDGWRLAFFPDGRMGYIQDVQIEVAPP